MKTLLLTLVALWFSLAPQTTQAQPNSKISQEDSLLTDIQQIRRHFHRHPELAGHEIKTKQFIVDYLRKLGLRVETQSTDNSVIGILATGKPGKQIAWRADMDALPMRLHETVDYRSTQAGLSHGCGHDAHMAIALGIAKVLTEKKASLKGTIYFIFQPEEETFQGAKQLLQSSLLSTIQLDEIYALHVTALPVGEIMSRPNEIFAHQRRLQLRFDNTVNKDRVQEAVQKIGEKLRRNNGRGNPADISQITHPTLGLSSSETIFKDYCIVDNPFQLSEDSAGIQASAYIYETDHAKIADMIPSIKSLLQAQQLDSHIRSIRFTQANISIQNDPRLTAEALHTLSTVQPKVSIKQSQGQVPYFNDDFAYFQQQIPGVYFLLGASNPDLGIVAMNHHPDFQIDERCLGIGVAQFSALLFHRAQQ